MNRMILMACIVSILAQQPVKTPEGKGAAKGKRFQSARQSTPGKNDDKLTIQTAPVPVVSADSKPESIGHSDHSSKSNDDEKIQEQLALFTLLLVIVGFLQVIALVWQAFLFSRQAGIMREHRTSLEQLAKSAIDNAESASKNSDFSKANAEAMEKSVGVLEKQAVLMEEQIKNAKNSGAKSIEIAQTTAKAASDNANAAKRSAEALIASERAWVMVDIEWQLGAHILEGMGSEGNENTGIYVDFVCRNQGKSFAQITEKGYVLRIASTLPQEPDFSDIDIFHYASEYVAPAAATEPYKLSGIMFDGRRKFNNLMVIYGRVKYQDVYGEHETRFGYLITGMGKLDRLPVSSYPEYNKHI